MSVEFSKSETKINLMRAFAGESQARNRYTFAASAAKKQNLYVIEAIFKFTADQEKEHAEIFFKHLKQQNSDNIEIQAGYPVDLSESVQDMVKFAAQNEYEEFNDIYKTFGDIASKEGFLKIASDFHNIALIEKTHADRFNQIYELMESGKLFVSECETKWMCLNCGNLITAKEVPEKCPVCSGDKGYFIRLKFAPYSCCD